MVNKKWFYTREVIAGIPAKSDSVRRLYAVHIAELVDIALKAWGASGWEAWHAEELPDGGRAIYFKISSEDLPNV